MAGRTMSALVAAIALAGCAMAQEEPEAPGLSLVRVPAQVDADAIALYDGVAPGSETWTHEEVWSSTGTQRWARNVVRPTLLPVLPEGDATGAAVLVVPGGGFQFVSMDNEGYPIAEWLAENGIAAFVLKYRVMETPSDEGEMAALMARLFDPSTPAGERPDINKGIPFAVADAQTALKLIESRAQEWRIDTDRIGMLGFSAGARTTLGVTLAAGDAPGPDFIGYIYGGMSPVDVPPDAPPMFAALAADDGLFGAQGFGIVESWRRAGIPVELHYYEQGGHGFGSFQQGVTADLWFEQFLAWMKVRGLLESGSSSNSG